MQPPWCARTDAARVGRELADNEVASQQSFPVGGAKGIRTPDLLIAKVPQACAPEGQTPLDKEERNNRCKAMTPLDRVDGARWCTNFGSRAAGFLRGMRPSRQTAARDWPPDFAEVHCRRRGAPEDYRTPSPSQGHGRPEDPAGVPHADEASLVDAYPDVARGGGRVPDDQGGGEFDRWCGRFARPDGGHAGADGVPAHFG